MRACVSIVIVIVSELPELFKICKTNTLCVSVCESVSVCVYANLGAQAAADASIERGPKCKQR